jgi:hypothetical protein
MDRDELDHSIKLNERLLPLAVELIPSGVLIWHTMKT